MKLPMSIVLMSLIAVAGCSGRHGTAQAQRLPSYRLVGYWTEAGGRALNHPYGIAIDPRNGNVLVTDAENHRVVIFDESGGFLREFGEGGDGPGQFDLPTGVAVGPGGSIYVSDYMLDRIQKFTEQGEFLLQWGESGSGEAQFSSPVGLAVGPDRNVYVADYFNSVIKVFDEEGQFIGTIGRPGRQQLGALNYPTDVDVGDDGQVLVADAYNYRVQIFSPPGEPLAAYGWQVKRPDGGVEGFEQVYGAAFGPGAKRIHLADGGSNSGHQRIVLLDEQGRFQTARSIPDAGHVNTPMQIALSPDGRRAYATDIAGDRIIILGVE